MTAEIRQAVKTIESMPEGVAFSLAIRSCLPPDSDLSKPGFSSENQKYDEEAYQAFVQNYAQLAMMEGAPGMRARNGLTPEKLVAKTAFLGKYPVSDLKAVEPTKEEAFWKFMHEVTEEIGKTNREAERGFGAMVDTVYKNYVQADKKL